MIKSSSLLAFQAERSITIVWRNS